MLQLPHMKPLLAILIAALLLTVSASAQTHDFTQWVKKKTVDGKEIIVLRVPETEFGSNILGLIGEAENDLDRLTYLYKGSYAPFGGSNVYDDIERYCVRIEKEDPTYPVHYYRDEMKAFKALREEMDQKALAKKKAAEDKAFFEQLKSNYAWISGDTLNVRTKPDTKAPTIGKLLRLSYIKAYQVENNEDWVEVNFGEHSGYVLRDYVAIDWEELAPSHEDSARLVTGQQYHFIPTAAYTAQLKKAAAEEEREEARAMRAAESAPRRKYYRGPRGGCYFIDSKGNKQYVDHSYCN